VETIPKKPVKLVETEIPLHEDIINMLKKIVNDINTNPNEFSKTSTKVLNSLTKAFLCYFDSVTGDRINMDSIKLVFVEPDVDYCGETSMSLHTKRITVKISLSNCSTLTSFIDTVAHEYNHVAVFYLHPDLESDGEEWHGEYWQKEVDLLSSKVKGLNPITACERPDDRLVYRQHGGKDVDQYLGQLKTAMFKEEMLKMGISPLTIWLWMDPM